MEPSFHNQPTARQTEAYLRCSGLKTVFSLGTCEKISYAGIVICMEKDFRGQLPAELKKIIPWLLGYMLLWPFVLGLQETADTQPQLLSFFL